MTEWENKTIAIKDNFDRQSSTLKGSSGTTKYVRKTAAAQPASTTLKV